MRTALLALALATGTTLAEAADTPAPAPITGAVLQGLDKITARVSRFDAPLGHEVAFGKLLITVKDCRKHPPEETPEAAAWLDIDVLKPGASGPEHLFSGWMFASSPAISALEDPIYDVWVVDCSTANTSPGKSG